MLSNLKKLRESYGLSQRSLADAIGISQQSVNKYENHNIEPDIETLIKLAHFFDTSVDYIIGIADNPKHYSISLNDQLIPDEIAFLRNYRKLSAARKKAISVFLQSLIDE